MKLLFVLGLLSLVVGRPGLAVEPKDVEQSRWELKVLDDDVFILFKGVLYVNRGEGTLVEQDTGTRGSLSNIRYSFLPGENGQSKTGIYGAFKFKDRSGSFTMRVNEDGQTFTGTYFADQRNGTWKGTRINPED